jgi:ATP-dependent exoDNAse (exonuclease V) beta subunit
VAGLAPVAAVGENGDGGLAATETGDAVHRLLELVPLDHPKSPDRVELETAVRGWYPHVSDEELQRIAALVEAYCASELAQRVAGLPGAAVERPFTFEHDGVLLHGRLDVFWRDGTRAVVVDYKSNVLEDAEPAAIVEAEYTLQRLVYALACLRAGVQETEIVYQFLEQPDELVTATFTTQDVPALEAELSAAIARIRAGDFRPAPSDSACAGCPALDLVCAGPRLPFAG